MIFEQQCQMINHQGEQIKLVCLSCNKILCFKCYHDVNEHKNHQTKNLEDFYKEIQQFLNQSDAQSQLLELIALRARNQKLFNAEIQTTLKYLDKEFEDDQQYFKIQLKELTDFLEQPHFTQQVIQVYNQFKYQNLMSMHYEKLFRLYQEQKDFLDQMIKQFRNYSHNLTLKNILDEYIQNKQFLYFVEKSQDFLYNVPLEYQLIRGDSFERKKKVFQDGIYYGELKGSDREGLGLLITNDKQILNGIWLQNQIQWGVKQFIEENNIFVEINGYFDSSFNNCGQCQMTKSNGQKYQGEMFNGEPNGTGTYAFESGNIFNIYEGTFKKGLFDGRGILSYFNGDKYEGEFLQQRRNGLGKLFYNNGFIYEGLFFNDQIHGDGSFFYNNLLIKKGNFINSIIKGEGYERFVNFNNQQIEAEYFGQFNDTIEGYGQMKFSNGDKWTGIFKGEYLNGIGEQLIMPDTRSVGNFTQCQLNGFGYRENNQLHLCGWFKNGQLIKGITINKQKQEYYCGSFDQYCKLNGKGVYYSTDLYKGFFIEGKQCGQGKTIFKNGDIHQGNYQNGKLNGKGKYTYINGDIYEGEFVENMKQGEGILILKNKTKFEGLFEEDFYKNGKLLEENGDEYIGQFNKGLKHGKGFIKFINGDEYDGEFNNNFIEGQGIYKKKLNDKIVIYNGQFKENLKQGQGKEIITNLDNEKISEYEGQFEKDKMQGKGSIKLLDKIYIGTFQEGEITGFGKIQYNNKDIYSGDVQGGQRQGQGEQIFINHPEAWKCYRGFFQHDNIEGKGVLEFLNGDNYDGEFKNNKITGQGTMKKGNGYLYIGKLLNGKRHGNGTLKQGDKKVYEGEWNDDLYNGLGKLFKDGQLYQEGDFVNGMLNGFGKEYYENTNITRYQGNWEKGQKQGKGKLYLQNLKPDQNPKLEYDGYFDKNKKCGQGLFYPTDPTITRYLGEFVDDCKDGYGDEMYESNQDDPYSLKQYLGYFSRNIRSGVGTYHYEGGTVNGSSINGLLQGENLTFIQIDNNKMVGKWDKGKPEGEHILYDQQDKIIKKITFGGWLSRIIGR